MKQLLLERKPTTATETEGFLSFANEILATLERPWIPAETPGGKSNESCIPDGDYQLIPHTRPGGRKALALINEGLGVYYLEDDRPHDVGRFLILIHSGNWIKDIIGCIAPGLAKGGSPTGPMVKSSRAAVERILDYVDGDDATLRVRWI